MDSDYAADSSRRSTQGIVVMMNGGPISWSSVLGKTICTSTAEAEVTAAVPDLPIESDKKSTWTELTHTDSLGDSSPSLRLPVEEGCLSAPP